MKKIVLLSCVAEKQEMKSKAKDLYISPLFKKSYEYGKSLLPDKILILSAKHYVLNLDDEVEPYDLTLKKMSKKECEKWAVKVLEMLKKNFNLQEDQFIFLTGNEYSKNIKPYTKNRLDPMEGLRLGERMKWLNEQIIKDEFI